MPLDHERLVSASAEEEMNDILAQQEANADYHTEQQEAMMGGLSWSYQD